MNLYSSIPALLLLLPLTGAILCCFLKGKGLFARAILAAIAVIELALTVYLFFASGGKTVTLIPDYLVLDSTGEVFLLVTNILFALISCHCLRFLPAEEEHLCRKDHNSGAVMGQHLFCAFMLGFLCSMTLVIMAGNFGILWVAVESTTILSAPLILYHRTGSSLEAMWKYLLICSVGIAFALFGTMLLSLAVSAGNPLYRSGSLSFDELFTIRNSFSDNFFKGAFIFILAGYGTKMGLAPFHTWLPDAHSEAPGPVSALLSGALLNCSFLGICRLLAVTPERLMPFCNNFLLVLGLLSLAAAGCFMIRQSDYKRMLAYSSVEHMGLLAILMATSGLASPLWKLHAVTHSMLKMTLFLLAGNFLLGLGTRHIPHLSGLAHRMPRNSWLWMAALLLICGVPPSPLFFTEFILLFQLPLPIAMLTAFLLLVVFGGMTWNMLKMLMGPDGKVIPEENEVVKAEKLCFIPTLSLVLVVIGGIWLLWVLICEVPFLSTAAKTLEI